MSADEIVKASFRAATQERQATSAKCMCFSDQIHSPSHPSQGASHQQLSVCKESTAHIEKAASFPSYFKRAAGQDAEYTVPAEMLTNSDFLPCRSLA